MARYRILSDDSTSFEISLRDESFVVMELPDSLISFDRSGRFLGAFLDGINFRRGMDNRFQKRWRLSRENQQQENLSNSEAENLMERIQNILWKLIRAEDIKNQPNLLKMAEKCTRNDWEILRDDGLKFLEICGGVPILPPDQYRALVIRATIGCSYNRCLFCNLYQNISFKTVPMDEFLRHLDEVAEFYGAGISYRKSIFLGDANALILKSEFLKQRIRAIQNHPILGKIARGGIGSFIDVFTEIAELENLHMFGVNRVALGVESGSEDVLQFINKQGNPKDALSLIHKLKRAKIAVTPIFLIGIGGEKFREIHREESLRLIEKMPLEKGDIIYLSKFISDGKISGLAPQTLNAEIERWKKEIDKPNVKTVSYNFQRFIY